MTRPLPELRNRAMKNATGISTTVPLALLESEYVGTLLPGEVVTQDITFTDAHANYTLSNGDLTAAHATSVWNHVKTDFGRSTGKYWFEVLCDIGGTGMGIAVAQAGDSTGNFAGSTATSVMFDTFGQKFRNGAASVIGSTFGAGDSMMMVFDMDATTLSVVDDTDTLIVMYTDMPTGTYFPSMSNFASTKGTINLGETTPVRTIPSGTTAWNVISSSSVAVSPAVLGWKAVFDAAAIDPGGHNERFFKYLLSLGFTASTLPERERDYWVAIEAA